MLRAILILATAQLLLAPLALASGGSIYHNGIGFTVIGIDDGTWTEINICDSEENATDGRPPHCLVLKKGPRMAGGWMAYSDPRSGCRLMGKYEEQNFATGDTDDEFMLSQLVAIIKVPKGMRACTLIFNGTGTPVHRSVTGLYRSS